MTPKIASSWDAWPVVADRLSTEVDERVLTSLLEIALHAGGNP
jgi:hypothetical protein